MMMPLAWLQVILNLPWINHPGGKLTLSNHPLWLLLYNNEERVGLPIDDYMAEPLNVMGKQICPANIDLQLKQVNEEIYSRQGGQMCMPDGRMAH